LTKPNTPVFYDYTNTREFSPSNLTATGDLGPEGICTLEFLKLNRVTQKPTGFWERLKKQLFFTLY
jgi:hypothetical protein